MSRVCQIAERKDRKALAEFLSKEDQLLLPMLELIEQAEMAVDELIDVMGRATIEAVLTLSAQQIAAPKEPGNAGGAIRWHGRQNGVVSLSERKLRVSKPRLRRKGKGKGLETEIPPYEALRGETRQRHSWTPRNGSAASWATRICGYSKRTSTTEIQANTRLQKRGA